MNWRDFIAGIWETPALRRRVGELEASCGLAFPEKPDAFSRMPWGEVYEQYLQSLSTERGIEVKDAIYDVILKEGWERFNIWNPATKRSYNNDLWDCENYAVATEFYAYEWGYHHNLVLPLGSVLGRIPPGYSKAGEPHAWNIIFLVDGMKYQLAFLDNTPGWPWTGRIHSEGWLWKAAPYNFIWL